MAGTEDPGSGEIRILLRLRDDPYEGELVLDPIFKLAFLPEAPAAAGQD